jgi:pyruvate/2-oxoglutarate dehydrogenase complex dihydrolipoamide acyltransferase (E2) component
MADVVFPALSKDNPDAEGVVATWFVDDGSAVSEGQLIAEVAVDKVDVEVLAPQAGTVRIMVGEGEAARQGSVIATVG